MDLKTGIICSLSLVLLICTVCSDAFAIRRPENEELVRALARLDRALGEMISSPDDPHELSEPMKRNEDGAVPYKRNEDGSTPYKRNEGSSRKRLAVDGPVPYKRFSEGDVPYKRDGNTKRQDYGDDTDIPFRRETEQQGKKTQYVKRGWLWNKPSEHPGHYDDIDEDNPYKRQYDYGDDDFDDIDADNPYKRQYDYGDDIDIPYKRRSSTRADNTKPPGGYGDDTDVPFRRSVKDESLDRVLRYLLDMEERLHERNTEKRDHDDQ